MAVVPAVSWRRGPRGHDVPPVGRKLPAVLTFLTLLATGCARTADPVTATPARTTAVSPARTTVPAGTTTAGLVARTVGTTSVSVELPAGVAWAPDGERRSPSGATILRWRYQPPGSGPACVVTLGRLDRFRGSFPSAAIAAFNGAREPGVETLRNEPVVPPPGGAVAAVRQEQRFVSALPVPSGTPGHLYGLQVLTGDGALVVVVAAAPDAAAPLCRPEEVVASLRLRPPPGSPSSLSSSLSSSTLGGPP